MSAFVMTSSLCFSFLMLFALFWICLCTSLSSSLFLVVSIKVSILWWFLLGINFLLVRLLFLHWYWSLVNSFYIRCFYIVRIIFHFFIEFFFIWFTFWIVGTKSRLLFRILSTSVISFLLLKIITMPAGSDWSPIEFLIVFHTLIVDLHSLTKLVIVIKTILLVSLAEVMFTFFTIVIGFWISVLFQFILAVCQFLVGA